MRSSPATATCRTRTPRRPSSRRRFSSEDRVASSPDAATANRLVRRPLLFATRYSSLATSASMPYVNEHYLKLSAGYLFPEIARRVAAFAEANPDKGVIRMGIGDVTEPLPPAVIAAMHKAVDDQANRETFHGYGPSEGYPWLREKIAKHDFAARGCEIAA